MGVTGRLCSGSIGWLQRLFRELIAPWQAVSRNLQPEWEVCSEMIVKTDPAQGKDMPLNIFSGRIEGTGRVSLSTLHSAKGREFDAVVLYGMNAGDIPSRRDQKSLGALREARRLFYVGVIRDALLAYCRRDPAAIVQVVAGLRGDPRQARPQAVDELVGCAA
jgi:superfamily I DNA/RNA helicase